MSEYTLWVQIPALAVLAAVWLVAFVRWLNG